MQYFHEKYSMQGRTDRLDPLPQEVLHSQIMLLAPKGVTMFLSSYEKHTVSWHISWHAPQSLAVELNAKLQDPTTAQVGWQALNNPQIMTLDNRQITTRTLQASCGSGTQLSKVVWMAEPDFLSDLLLLLPLFVLCLYHSIMLASMSCLQTCCANCHAMLC